MKTQTLPLLVLATLLSTNSFSQSSNKTNKISTVATTKNEKQPIYNLYQLSQLLAGDQENKRTIGYLNHLIATSNESLKDVLKNRLYKHVKFDSNKANLEKILTNILFNNLDGKADEDISSLINKIDFGSELQLKKDLEKALGITNKHKNEKQKELAKQFKVVRNLNETLFNYKKIEILPDINSVLEKNKFNKIETLNYEAIVKLKKEILNSKSDDNIVIPETLKNNLNTYKQKIVSYYEKKNKSNTKNKYSNISISIKDESNLRFLCLEADDITFYDEINYEKDSLIHDQFENQFNKKNGTFNFINELEAIIIHYASVRDLRDKEFKSLLNNIEKELLHNNIINDGLKNEFNQFANETTSSNLSTQNPIFTIQTVESKASVASSGFKMPSESDVIMGMAKFMANRAKQETMIWFIDKLRNDMRDDLIKETFPKTLSLLEDQEELAIPEFNETWQLALSEDFVKMPNNIINSKWVAEKIGDSEQLNTLKSTVNISSHFFKLMNGKNDYRTILEQLYLQQQAFTPNKENTENSLFESLTFLYILSNEFYQIDTSGEKPIAQLLGLNDFERMTSTQWDILLDLIHLKYGQKAHQAFKNMSLNTETKNLSALNAKFTSIFNGFKALNKISANEDYSSKEKKAIALLDQVLILLKHIDPKYNEITNEFDADNYSQLTQFEHLLGVYKSIHHKEFGEAAKATLNLIKPLIGIDEFEVEINNDSLIIYNEKLTGLFSQKTNNDKILATSLSTFKTKNSEIYKIAKKGNNIRIEVKSNFETLKNKIKTDFEKSKLENQKLLNTQNSDKENIKPITIFNSELDASKAKISKAKALYDKLESIPHQEESENQLSQNSILETIKKQTNKLIEHYQAESKSILEKNTKSDSIKPLSEKELNELIKSIETKEQELINTKNKKSIDFKKSDNDSHVTEVYTINIKKFKENLKELKKLNDSKGKYNKQLAKDFAKQILETSFIEHQYYFEDEQKNILTKDFIQSLIPDATFDDNGLNSLNTLCDIINLVDNPSKVPSKLFKDDFLLKDLTKSLSAINPSAKLLVKTTTFFTDILRSPDKDGVYRAIENAVAPPTSYLTKRKYPHTLSLNGYVGGYAGYQHVRVTPSDFKNSFTYGITAPIGFTYSTPKWGIFVQGIDLGNLVGHYLWEVKRDFERQQVSIKEVFSPGINFLYNIPDSPFVFFTGFKMIQIEERFDENRGFINSGTLDLVQFSAGIKIDIPFFTIKKW